MKTYIFKDRIFIFAIFLSLVWHVFWLSIITVTVTPDHAKPIKFSRVSFLGPILERGALEVRIKPKEPSFLEKRYLSGIGNISTQKISTPGRKDAWPAEDLNIKNIADGKLVNLIEDTLSGSKVEPQ